MLVTGEWPQLPTSHRQVFSFDSFDSSDFPLQPLVPPPALNAKKFDFDIVAADSNVDDDGMDATVNDTFTIVTGTHTAVTASPSRHNALKGLRPRPMKEVKIVHGSSPKGLFSRSVSTTTHNSLDNKLHPTTLIKCLNLSHSVFAEGPATIIRSESPSFPSGNFRQQGVRRFCSRDYY